ncbi:hypothetical protein SB861_37865 [Paraburkholderia sp. SIMBA_049]
MTEEQVYGDMTPEEIAVLQSRTIDFDKPWPKIEFSHNAHVLAYGMHRHCHLNSNHTTEDLIWDSWARDLDHDQVQEELAEIGRDMTIEQIAAEYSKYDAEYAAECAARGGHNPGSILSKNKAHLFQQFNT